jgi:hypothetical protein
LVLPAGSAPAKDQFSFHSIVLRFPRTQKKEKDGAYLLSDFRFDVDFAMVLLMLMGMMRRKG